MKAKVLLAGLILNCFLFFSCKEEKKRKPLQTTDSSTTRNLSVKEDIIDTIGPTATVFRFMNWYKTNPDSVSTVQGRIVKEDTGGINEDSSNIEKISIPDLELYIQLLLRSGYISTTYTDDFKNFILREGHSAKTNNYSLVNFFGADPILHAQDTYFLNDLSKAKINTRRITGNKAIVIINFFEGPELFYTLSFIKGKWLIDEIDQAPWLEGEWILPHGETGSGNKFFFNEENMTFEFQVDSMQCDQRIRSYAGNWTIKEDSLFLSIKKEVIWEGGKLTPSVEGDACASAMKIINGKLIKRTLSTPKNKVMLISGVKCYANFDNMTIRINGEKFFFVQDRSESDNWKKNSGYLY